MKYINAESLLPESLVRELQLYVRGAYIYVPAGTDSRRRWGELSGAREELDRRNREITGSYRSGESVEALSERYHLSSHAIRKIIYGK